MKRIGILTFHTSINNGAVMQCYSLSKKLQEAFPDTKIEVIDYRMPKVEWHYDASVKRFLSGGSLKSKCVRLLSLICHPRQLQWQKKRKAAFESVRNVLPLSTKAIVDDGTQALFAYMNRSFDAVVVGSDAIWNYVVRGFPNPYFLDETVTCKKLTYAASCYGMNYEAIPQQQKQSIGKILDTYAFLGTRDGESEKFVGEMGCSQAPVHTCDPTVFLNVDDLPVDVKVLEKKLADRGFDFDKPTIGVMGTEQMCGMVRELYSNQYQIASVYNYCRGADVNLYDLTPYEWAYVFRYFKLVVTTYFHGTMLPLRNGIPVINIALQTQYSQKHMTKVEDFMLRVGLRDCYFATDYKGQNYAQIKAKADELLAKDCKADICARMDREAQSHIPFIEKLREVLNED